MPCMEHLAGIGGYARGTAFVYSGPSHDLSRRKIEDIEAERTRFSVGRDAYRKELSSCAEEAIRTLEQSTADIFTAYLDILDDDSFFDDVLDYMASKHLNVEAAIQDKMVEVCALFTDTDDEMLRSRASDIENVCKGLCAHILGSAENIELPGAQDTPVILFADDLTPADTIRLDKSRLAGFVTQRGSLTSHTAILAKALCIPAIVGASNILQHIHNGDPVLLAGQAGRLIICPTADDESSFLEASKKQRAREAQFALYAARSAITIDGHAVQICQNAGDADSPSSFRSDLCDGVGLLRTEFLYMSCDHWPDEEEQFSFYRSMAQATAGKELIIRTLDIGGDKQIPYMHLPKEDNPFLGVRAIRVCLSNRAQFRVQLRAILRAAAYGSIKIMFPMIATLEDLLEARALVEEAARELDQLGIPYGHNVPIGIMVETPAAVLTSDILACYSDFFSIGANDLTQYLMAADRGNERLLPYQDFCSPALLRAIKHTVTSAHNQGIPVGICGEAAGIPLLTPAWVGLGVDELSMSVSQIPEVKYNVCNIRKSDAEILAKQAIQASSAQQVRQIMEDYSSRAEIKVNFHTAKGSNL